VRESSTRHRALNTNPLLTNYSFIARSLALSLALSLQKSMLIRCQMAFVIKALS